MLYDALYQKNYKLCCVKIFLSDTASCHLVLNKQNSLIIEIQIIIERESIIIYLKVWHQHYLSIEFQFESIVIQKTLTYFQVFESNIALISGSFFYINTIMDPPYMSRLPNIKENLEYARTKRGQIQVC